jgi:hypothetical protein
VQNEKAFLAQALVGGKTIAEIALWAATLSPLYARFEVFY